VATGEPGSAGQNSMFPGCKPFLVSCPADMKLAWLATGKGGATKRKEHFCYCCLLRSKDINKSNVSLCTLCEDRLPVEKDISAVNVEHECMHQEFITPDLMQRLRLQVLSCVSEEVIATHANVTKRTMLLLFEDDSDIQKCTNNKSIDYEA